jgi:hypothetical protein
MSGSESVRRTLVVLAAVASVVAFGAPAALAAPSWLAPERVSTIRDTGGTFTGDVAMNPRGDAAATWFGYDGTNFRIYVAVRPAGGPWGAEKALSTAGASLSAPEIAVANNGTIFAIWAENGIVKLATRSLTGAFGAPVTLSQAGADEPHLAIQPSGAAILVWQRNGVVEFLTRSASGVFSPPAGAQPLSDAGGGAGSLGTAAGPSGDLVVAWLRAGAVEARYRAAGAADFGAVEQPGPAGANISYGRPRAAIDAQNLATLV